VSDDENEEEFLAGISLREIGVGIRSDPVARPHVSPGAEAQPLSVETQDQTLSRVELDEALDREIDRQERGSLITLRERYSYALGGFLAIQLLFMNIVLLLVGAGAIQLSGATIQYYLAGTIGEIFGLVSVATHFLFSDKPFLGGRFSRKAGKRTPR
jgi:hypothetical protein